MDYKKIDNNMSSSGFIGMSNVSPSTGAIPSPTVVVEATSGENF